MKTYRTLRLVHKNKSRTGDSSANSKISLYSIYCNALIIIWSASDAENSKECNCTSIYLNQNVTATASFCVSQSINSFLNCISLAGSVSHIAAWVAGPMGSAPLRTREKRGLHCSSALQVPLLREGAITNGHGHISFETKWVDNLHALPHRHLIQPIVLLQR